VLNDILSKLPASVRDPNLLVGVETGDDSAVYRINKDQAIVATTDFFMPIVDDPFDFGRIAATNALSDIYAVGGKPILALAIAGFPVNEMSEADIGKVLEGGAKVCTEAGIPIAGGHTVDSLEPIYGLAVVGIVHPDKIKRNSDGCADDVLILGKGLGVGILGAALNKDDLDSSAYKTLVETTTKLNSVGAELAQMPQVNALTDVTGFGLCGHLHEMCEGAGLSAILEWDKLPILENVKEYALKGYNTGAAIRNFESFKDFISIPNSFQQWQINLLMDPQTSGGLLVSCSPASVDSVLEVFYKSGFEQATAIGSLFDGGSKIIIK